MVDISKKFADTIKLLDIQRVRKFAIACSGGPDSMALALLAHEISKTQGMECVAITVDHALRPESAQEAKQVGIWLTKRGIKHVTLKWSGKKPTRNIQESARIARYRLIADYCAANAIAHVFVAHHLEDQAETFLLRLARGSGVDGLSAMAPVAAMHNILLVRPLLDVPKADLLAFLKLNRQSFLQDPSNENMLYDRVKMRALLPRLCDVGLTPDRLAKTASIMARARAHLEEETGKFLAQHCKIFPEGYAVLRSFSASEEIGFRAISTLIMIIGGNEVRMRLADLERLYASLKKPDFKSATLGGCVFARHQKGVLVYRELKAVAKPGIIKPGQSTLWDNRFCIELSSAPHALRIGALTQEGWLFCAKMHALESAVPDKRILYTLPALRDKTGWLFAVPHLGLSADGVKCRASFKSSS